MQVSEYVRERILALRKQHSGQVRVTVHFKAPKKSPILDRTKLVFFFALFGNEAEISFKRGFFKRPVLREKRQGNFSALSHFVISRKSVKSKMGMYPETVEGALERKQHPEAGESDVS